MKRKLIYLPSTYSKEVVDDINSYFDKGYEIEDILNADNGYYILLVMKEYVNYSYVTAKKDYSTDKKINLIEEGVDIPTWVKSSTKNMLFN